MLKRLLALLMTLMLLTPLVSLAEEDEADDDLEGVELTQKEIDEVMDLDAVDESADEPIIVVGEIYQEPSLKEFNKNSPALYKARIKEESSIFSERSIESKRVTYNRSAVRADVLYVGTAWTVVRYKGYIGFVKRDRLSEVEPLDPKNTPPYGVQKHQYIATTADVCEVRKSMSDQDDSYVVLNPGTRLSIWQIQDGWAIVNYWRTYGYININDLTDLIPVSPTDDPIRDDTPIAAYTSYYKMVQTESNISRITNIAVACRRLTRTMVPGDSLNFNKMVGPYKKANGYQQAPVLVNGVTKPGYGGGTCQVSSTLYNALIQLPGVEILQRRPHGPSGASYLPHGVDAAVGSDALNLRFRNNYDFPIRVEGHTSDDGALLMVVYKVSE